MTETAIVTAIGQATGGWKQPGKVKNIVARAIKAGRANPRDVKLRK